MSILYKAFAATVYSVLWPYGRIRAGMGNKLWRDRLGLLENIGPCDVWIHAASVGEAKVAGYMIDYLINHKPNITIYLTTMTVAGQKEARQNDSNSVTTGYFPIDNSAAIKRTLDKVNPKVLVITETEIWPNLIEQTNSRNIPIVLVNGRMSDRAFKKYKLVSKTMKRVLSCYEKFFMKTEQDKEKLTFFDIDRSKIAVSGDMKFDAPLLKRSEGRRNEIRSRLGAGENDFVFVAGSTRPGEELILLQLLKNFKNTEKNLILVIAPRHLNRLDEIKRELSNRKVGYSTYGDSNSTTSIILIQQMGMLNDLYQAADLSFVGGTLVNIGGHNILEPVWAGSPVLFGPFTANVDEAKEYILKNNYGAIAENIEELVEQVTNFVNGSFSLSIKKGEDLEHSPTAVAGEYIIEKLANA